MLDVAGNKPANDGGSLIRPFIGSQQLDLTQLLFLVIGILGAQALFSYFRVLTFSYVSEKAMADVRLDVYRKLISLPMGFFDKRRVGELTSRIMADVSQLQGLLSTTLAELLRQFVVLSVGMAALFIKSPRLTLFMMAIVPAVMVVAAILAAISANCPKARRTKWPILILLLKKPFKR